MKEADREEQAAAHTTVRIRYFAMLRDLVGREREEIQLPAGATVGDAIAALVSRNGDAFKEFVLTADGQLRPQLTVLINGEVVNPARIGQTVLPQESELVIMPPIGGGQSLSGMAADHRSHWAGSGSSADPVATC